MLDHVTIKVSNPEISRNFYSSALAALGYEVLIEIPKEYVGGKVVLGLGVAPKPDLWLGEGEPNEPRLHVAFRADHRGQVDAFYKAALAAGGRDHGAPGPRPH